MLDEYVNNIKLYLKNIIIIDLQSSDIWKIQLKIAINFVFSNDTEEEREMYSTSDNIKFFYLIAKSMKLSMKSLNHFFQEIRTV